MSEEKDKIIHAIGEMEQQFCLEVIETLQKMDIGDVGKDGNFYKCPNT